MSMSVTPAMQVIAVPEPAPADRSNAQRLSAAAADPDVRSVAAEAVQAEAPAALPGEGSREPAAVVQTGAGEATVHVWDVNGDGAKDAVLRDDSTGAASALLNRGGNDAPAFSGPAVSISAPTGQDLNTLSVTGNDTGRSFLAADLDGSGLRQLAVKRSDGQWLSLGGSRDQPGVVPVDQAEDRFDEIVSHMLRLLPSSMQLRGLWNSGLPADMDDWTDMMARSGNGIPYGYDTATPTFGNLVPLDASFSMMWGFLTDEIEDPAEDSDDDEDDAGPGGLTETAASLPGFGRRTPPSR